MDEVRASSFEAYIRRAERNHTHRALSLVICTAQLVAVGYTHATVTHGRPKSLRNGQAMHTCIQVLLSKVTNAEGTRWIQHGYDAVAPVSARAN